ncbi:hypothetical protein PENSPDRAFT_758207 [Peniophora sp. CONT]|nr:hypothetical protein PENSPDRAFT_758207 [Peniophora sp. CONT]
MAQISYLHDRPSVEDFLNLKDVDDFGEPPKKKFRTGPLERHESQSEAAARHFLAPFDDAGNRALHDIENTMAGPSDFSTGFPDGNTTAYFSLAAGPVEPGFPNFASTLGFHGIDTFPTAVPIGSGDQYTFGLNQQYTFDFGQAALPAPDYVLPPSPAPAVLAAPAPPPSSSTPAVLAAAPSTIDIPVTPPVTPNDLNDPLIVLEPKHRDINTIIRDEDIEDLPSDASIAEKREMLQSVLMHTMLQGAVKMNRSQVWRVDRDEDGTVTFMHPIRPARGGINGEYTNLGTLNFDLKFECCDKANRSQHKSARDRHLKQCANHLGRLRPYCLDGLIEVGIRKRPASSGKTDKTTNGMTNEIKTDADNKRKALIKKVIQKFKKDIKDGATVNDDFVATLVDRWDVLPDVIAAKLPSQYFAFPERYIQMRDAFYAQENVDVWTPPTPVEVVRAVDNVMKLHGLVA